MISILRVATADDLLNNQEALASSDAKKFCNPKGREKLLNMDVLNRPADEFGNDNLLEELWAKRAFEHAELHFNLLCSVDPRFLKLTPYDDIIYKAFREEFPDLKIESLQEDDLKSANAKLKWRNFIERFNKLDDFAFGTLLRANSTEEFSPENAIFVVRIQFLAIEIARNKEGCNDSIRKTFAGRQKPEDVS